MEKSQDHLACLHFNIAGKKSISYIVDCGMRMALSINLQKIKVWQIWRTRKISPMNSSQIFAIYTERGWKIYKLPKEISYIISSNPQHFTRRASASSIQEQDERCHTHVSTRVQRSAKSYPLGNARQLNLSHHVLGMNKIFVNRCTQLNEYY